MPVPTRKIAHRVVEFVSVTALDAIFGRELAGGHQPFDLVQIVRRPQAENQVLSPRVGQ